MALRGLESQTLNSRDPFPFLFSLPPSKLFQQQLPSLHNPIQVKLHLFFCLKASLGSSLSVPRSSFMMIFDMLQLLQYCVDVYIWYHMWMHGCMHIHIYIYIYMAHIFLPVHLSLCPPLCVRLSACLPTGMKMGVC